jgi:hypothetical protein
LLWSWKYRKASISDLDKNILLNNLIPVDSTTEFALWNWNISGIRNAKANHKINPVNEKISRAQILFPDGGLYLLPQAVQFQNRSICRYLDFASIRIFPQKLSFEMSKQITEALKIINPSVTDVRLTDIESGLSVILDNKYSVTLGTIGNGAVTWASTLMAVYEITEELKGQNLDNIPVIVLIDEMGVGIHYSTMLDIWEYLRIFSEKYPYIQFVFTSHSDDCVRAFCEAFADSTQDIATIVRLHKTIKDNETVTKQYSKDLFSNIISGDWEVRG